jgi:hypothetical protein
MSHEQEVLFVFNRACEILKMRGFVFRPMSGRVDAVKNIRKSYALGHTNLKTKVITVDIFTAKRRHPKKISAILAVIVHELAHHQKPPYRQRYRGRWINRIHYPAFYSQVKKNMKKFKKDDVLGQYFN